ncbi:fumarylacetoacetate hydrolase family protein [Lentibacter algarum]|uniref:fumarylacetoacetate hydrolase family protein n=1 Tax=Lentibacter algarum TaxID=576131 RepID=UPI001C076348|nr:fumarylacetoacetate hydrolase family protein [Lentibacter algarum]MBU2982275.1 fumarylacetoacetate hydrolase family protein [Lentibacter algarum]
MKLLRYGPVGEEKPALLDAQGNIRDLTGVIGDLGGEMLELDQLERLKALDPASLPLVTGRPRIGACVSHVETFYGIGLNYAQHAREAGMDAPKEPIIFNKSASCLAGPNDALTLPVGSEKSDWEVELGVVIGRRAQNVSVEDALGYVAGYCVINDLSERAFQTERGGQWTKGKSAPGFGPCGPYIVTADQVPDPQSLRLKLSLNGAVMQDNMTKDMIFSVAEIIAHMSEFMALVPGDVIATGTPEGVGMGLKPQRFLRSGDVMELEIEGLGAQRTEVL